MVAGGAAGTVVIQNGFKPIYGFEWTPRRRGGGRGGEGEGEAAIGIYCLPSNSQILSQAALILHEEDGGRNGDIGGGMLQPPYSTSPASCRGFQ